MRTLLRKILNSDITQVHSISKLRTQLHQEVIKESKTFTEEDKQFYHNVEEHVKHLCELSHANQNQPINIQITTNLRFKQQIDQLENLINKK